MSSLDLLPPRPAFLSHWVLALFKASMFLAHVSVAQMKSAAFLKALTMKVSFCSARENLNRPFFSPFRKEVYITPSSRLGIRATT